MERTVSLGADCLRQPGSAAPGASAAPPEYRAFALLRCRAGVDPATLRAAIEEERRRLATLPTTNWVRCGLRSEETCPTAHSDAVSASFDAVIELGGPLPDVRIGLAGLAERFLPWVDPMLSASGAGHIHVIFEGSPRFLLVYALRRKPGMDRGDFRDYWLHVHGAAAKRWPGPPGGYSQIHFDPDISRAVSKLSGFGIDDFDGIALAGFPDLKVCNEFLSSPGVAKAALADERRFIDHERSALALV